MNLVRISGSNLELKKNKNLATLETVFGIGRARATKIISLLLTNPRKKQFKSSLVKLSQDLKTQRVFKSLLSDNLLRLAVYSDLEKKVRIGCYKARRILQNLPANGQRTHTNAGTPSSKNPFVTLSVKAATTQEFLSLNKRWELNWNGRSQDLVDFSNNASKKYKYSKAASLAKKKKAAAAAEKKKK